METFFSAILSAAAIGCGLMAGVYFTFSAFIMRALLAIPAASAIDAMNSINKVIVSSAFLPLFFGTTITSALIIVSAPFTAANTAALYAAIGGGVYLIGMFVCTIAINVPLNNKLAALDAGTQEARAFWQIYTRTWTRWNHVRTIASTVTMLLFIYAISIA